jgi:hypothetical protein
MNNQIPDQSTCKAADMPGTKHHGGYSLYRQCMYCGTIFGTTPCVESMHGKFTTGICPDCATCEPFLLLMPIEDAS